MSPGGATRGRGAPLGGQRQTHQPAAHHGDLVQGRRTTSRASISSFTIPEGLKRPKVNLLGQTPFDETLYLDNDTLVRADLSSLFDLLERFDMCRRAGRALAPPAPPQADPPRPPRDLPRDQHGRAALPPHRGRARPLRRLGAALRRGQGSASTSSPSARSCGKATSGSTSCRSNSTSASSRPPSSSSPTSPAPASCISQILRPQKNPVMALALEPREMIPAPPFFLAEISRERRGQRPRRRASGAQLASARPA